MTETRRAGSSETLERTYSATADEVWELWTTAAGIESWWGPEGFEVEVRTLDLRPGGEMTYAMKAVAPDQVDFMRKAGMPVSTETRLTFTEVDPPRRLAYQTVADFIPGVEPYLLSTEVAITPIAGGTRVLLTLGAMHNHDWTQRALMGWESQLGKLDRLLAR